MIQNLVGFCLLVGFSAARPFSPNELNISGNRPVCAEKTLTFCEKVDNYPTELIANLLKSAKFYGFDGLIVDESEGLDEPPEYIMNAARSDEDKIRKTRSINDSMGEVKLTKMCSVPSRMATPEIASNGRGEWRFIAQEESLNIQQKVKVHICSEEPSCQRSCMQFYAPVSMKSLSSDGKLIEDVFWVPSSCRCSNEGENML